MDIFNSLNTLFGSITAGLKTLVVSVGALSLAICGIGYMTSSNPQTAEKFKAWGIRILIGVVIVFAGQAFIETVKSYITGTTVGQETGAITHANTFIRYSNINQFLS